MSEELSKVRTAASEFVASAREMDQALVALEKACAVHQLLALDLARSLRKAGLSDDGRIGRMQRPFAKWSTWAAAPTFADMAEMARTPVSKRQSLESLVRNVIPAIPTEMENTDGPDQAA